MFSLRRKKVEWAEDSASALPLIGPVLGVGGEAGSDRVHADVMRFLDGGFQVAQAMIEEIPLPLDAVFGSHPGFHGGHDLPHGLRPGKTKQAVEVIGHRKGAAATQGAVRLSSCDGLVKRVPDFIVSKLVYATRDAADGDEKGFAFGIWNKGWRDIVGQTFATNRFHKKGKDDPVGTTRCGRP